jgi:tripartite-type tricarboxylate transporter receptor subunit TctC
VAAQDYPTKPVRIVVGFAAGSVSDIVARLVAQRLALLPDTPTIDEAGLPGVHASIWIGMLAPAGTPRPIVETLSSIINEALKTEEVARQLRLQGMEVLGGSPEGFGQRIKKDTTGWDAVLQATGAGK